MKRLMLLLTLLILVSNPGFAQLEFGQPDEQQSGPEFHMDVANFSVPEDRAKSRMNIYIEIAYDELQFIKVGDGFESEFEVSAVVFDDDDFQVDGKIWKETVFVKDFDLTNSRSQFAFTYKSFDLEPEKYKVDVNVENVETGNVYKRDFKTELKDFSKDELMTSDIILADRISADSLGIKTISPIVTDPTKGVTGDIFVYFEIYNPKDEDELKIEYEIKGERTRNRIKGEYQKPTPGQRIMEAIRIPTDSLMADEYNLTLKLNGDKDDFEVKKTFYVNWVGMPSLVRDLDKAIAQTEYVATREEWKKLDNAPEDERLEEFKEFWKRHDPTPGTELNEALQSYFSRVDFANRSFGTMNQEGWKTDMGMIYIILGGPDEVERNPFPKYSRYPYQVWQYYRFNRYFEFYDPTGFGDYRLATPFSIYEAQRLITR
jgi:GWxTD domain-containing protein